MKWIIASDIHGSAKYARLLLTAYDNEKQSAGAEKCRLLLLGDLLYHGPRNDLPEEYNPKEVISLLNSIKADIVCVRGNCDADVDQMVLEFPIMAEYIVIESGGRIFYCTHGHVYNDKNPLPLAGGDVLLCGHTHVPANTACWYIDKAGNKIAFTYSNPGSVSIPKNGSLHSYCVLQNGILTWKDLLSGDAFNVSL